MAEMLASVLVQEGVSGVISLAVSNREEKASQGQLMERLEMAQSELEFALERSRKMPITDVSLLRRRMVIKRTFKECTVMLDKHKVLVLGDEEVGQTTIPVLSSFRRKILCAVQPSVWFSRSPKKDTLSCSEVARFEWFAEKAGKFVRDVESGCSLLARNRFSNPMVTQLLEGKRLMYILGQGKKNFNLKIRAFRMEEHGVMARLWFHYIDTEAPMTSFRLLLMLRLSESTDIVGISTECLQSLGLNFKCLAEKATGQLAHLSKQVQVSNGDLLPSLYDSLIGIFRPDPVCCAIGFNKSCTSNAISSELSDRFPEQVTFFCFSCNVSGAHYNLRSSTKQVSGKLVKVWPYLELTASFAPHMSLPGRQVSTLHHMEETLYTEAINRFSCQPQQTEFVACWYSAHGVALFTVSKPIVDTRCAPRAISGHASTTQRVSKRKR